MQIGPNPKMRAAPGAYKHDRDELSTPQSYRKCVVDADTSCRQSKQAWRDLVFYLSRSTKSQRKPLLWNHVICVLRPRYRGEGQSCKAATSIVLESLAADALLQEKRETVYRCLAFGRTGLGLRWESQ